MIKELDAQEFKTVSAGDRLCVVDFNAQWCGPCRMLAPIMSSLSEKITEADFYSIDIDKEQQLAISNGIEAVPTVMLFKNGEAVGTVTGLRSESDMAAFIRSRLI